MRSRPDDDDDPSVSDEITTGDGTLRSWFYANGEGARTFAALTAAICAVAWCFLYVLGYGSSLYGIVLLILAAVSFLSFYGLVKEMSRYERNSWKTDRRSHRTERVEVVVAGALWLLIAIAVSLLLASKYHHTP